MDNAHHQKLIETIRQLKEELNLNVEEANPGDFIPLPAGWSDTSLGKIERGAEVDFEDVKALLKSGKINWEKFNSFYQEILPQYGKKSLKQDPARIRRNFEILGSQLKQN